MSPNSSDAGGGVSYYDSSTEEIPPSITMTLGVVVGIPVALSLCVFGSVIPAILLATILIGIIIANNNNTESQL